MLLASNKGLASVAACCSILDYISTAVVSAATAAAYFYFEFGFISQYWAVIVVLAVFGLLTMLGVRESSFVSLGILMLHMSTMLLVVIASVYQVCRTGPDIAHENFSSGSVSTQGWPMDLFLGYCVGMVGVTGFETSSNYIQEQAPGVFPKTLRNMCYLVLACNPVISLLALCLLPIATIVNNSSTVISVIANASFGRWLRVVVAIDAVIVLCGGVLTAFVGVGGLMEHMSNDNLLPSILLYQPGRRVGININEWKRATRISLPMTIAKAAAATGTGEERAVVDCDHNLVAENSSFMIASKTSTSLKIGDTMRFNSLNSRSSVLLFVVFNGDVTILSLVFSMAFLSVLGMFVACSLILRIRSDREAGGRKHRIHLGRHCSGDWDNDDNDSKDHGSGDAVGGLGIMVGFAVVVMAVIGNAVNNPQMLGTFVIFFAALIVVIWGFLNRVQIARVVVLLVLGGEARHNGDKEEEEGVVISPMGITYTTSIM
ncbi:hypothetical protein HK100_000626 [Physocladia obscura]|uniref:Amino acid transporter n=1 Tax=Physocladia obscura TaxID=109957 RepID=A0AAD5XFG9_9FUNG|nr:hypothetical protein HK100_000626 [Physocladia obscura]